MKRIISICAVLLLCTFCFATDIEEVIAKAYQNSPQVEQYERSRQDSLLTIEDSDRTFYYSIDIPSFTAYPSDYYFVPGSTLKVSYDKYGNNVKDYGLSATVKTPKIIIDDVKKSDSFSVSLELSKTFEFIKHADYEREYRDLVTEIGYMTNVLNFRKSVLSDVYSIVDAKHSLIESERKLAESQKDYNAKLATGELKEGTTAQIKAKMALDSTVSALDSQKKSLESKLLSFEKNYGFAYTDVDSASRPVLEFEKNPEGNSNVKMEKLNLLQAQQELDDATGKGKAFSLSTDIKPEMYFKAGSGYEDANVSMKAQLSYVQGKFSASASISEKIDKDGFSTPTITVSGSYSGGNVKSSNVIRLENKVLKQQLAYDTAVFNYNTSARTVEDNIQKALVAYDQLEIRKDYNNRILDYTTTLYENGFTTAKALEDARFEVESDAVDELLLNLQALQLECEIKILAL